MLVKLDGDGNVAQYPYSEAQLYADHPHVSFPGTIPSDGFPEFGVFPVVNVDPGPAPEGKHWELDREPTRQSDGTWTQAWVETDN